MSKEQSQEYRGNGNHYWEHVSTDTSRLRVPGGWIYHLGGNALDCMSFVPMPEVVKHAV